jgi:hypothetical protein
MDGTFLSLPAGLRDRESLDQEAPRLRSIRIAKAGEMNSAS